ncbi:YdcF family protein [Luteimonas sp. R10]|uniref:YdcF family protein n=1 Tax=Luteimonas sp. R10 TaxID=3108176 RepID=UPI00308ED87F|nr:YdcF family protein [Luteimonas sp. R10]
MSRRRRVGPLRWSLRLAVLLALWLAGVATYIIWAGERDQAAPADAIIVLGAAAYDARPSPVFEQRILHGVHLYQRGLADTLIFTGGYGGSGARFAESQVARRYALRQGVPEDAILIETVSRTTQQNLAEAAALMRERGLTRAILVSDPLHMARALRLARGEGIQPLGSATPTSRFRSLEARWQFLLREVYFFHRDRWAALTGTPAAQ